MKDRNVGVTGNYYGVTAPGVWKFFSHEYRRDEYIEEHGGVPWEKEAVKCTLEWGRKTGQI